MDAFLLLFALLVFDFFAIFFFIAKIFSRLDQPKFEKYKYLGPLLLFISGALDMKGYLYLVAAVLCGVFFVLGFGYLSSTLRH